MADNSEELDGIYNRFKHDLATDPDSMYYEEDELLDIFDYAGDLNDNYVRLNALFLGRRLYPESEALKVRTGLMLDDFTVSSLESFLNDNRGQKGVLWEILRLKSAKLTPAEAEERLNAIVDSYIFEEDEDIIQFVNLVEFLEKETWLVDNLERIKPRCKFPDTLMYETARLVNFNRRDVAIRLLEELTDMDPFNYDNWAQLAECYAEDGKMDDAVNALEYAKAIKPYDTELMFLEATLLLDRRENLDKAVSLLQNVISQVPGHFAAKRNLSMAFILQGKPDVAALLWEEELRKDPTDSLALQELIELDTELARRHVEAYYDAVGESESESTLIQRVENWALIGCHDKALMVMSVYNDKIGIKDAAPIFLRELYLAGKIKEAWDFFTSMRDDTEPAAYDLPSIAILAAVMLRTGNYADCITFCDHYVGRTYQVNGNPEHVLLVNGLRKTLSTIRDYATHPETIPSPDFDPLNLASEI